MGSLEPLLFQRKQQFCRTTLVAGTYYLIGDADVQADTGIAPNLVDTLSMGNGASSIDGVRLIDDSGVVIDTVLYGDTSNLDAWEDDNGPNPTSFAPEASGNGETIARIPNGVDTNLSGDDFILIPPDGTVYGSPWLRIYLVVRIRSYQGL